MAWDFETDPEFQKKLDWIEEFMREEVEPISHLGIVAHGHIGREKLIRPLQEKVKAQGLWACHLGPELGGQGYGQLKLGLMNEKLGRNGLAPTIFGCQAPDTGNAEIIAHYGTDKQKEQYLWPLLNGEIRSAFSMSEPTGGSDPLTFKTRAVLDGNEWVINGEKWYSTNAKWAKVLVVYAITDPDAKDPYRRTSIFLVPTDTPGVKIIGPQHVFGDPDAPHGHMHIVFDNVRVPKENMLLGEGRGFEISQLRLGPGRIHHCMRAIGAAEYALELMCKRAMTRVAFGKPLAKLGGNIDVVANARMAIEQARLLTLKAAWMMDTVGVKGAMSEISQIKVVAPNMATQVIDAAMQMHGGAGLSEDFPLTALYAYTRVLRIADGPDEVHRLVIGKLEFKKQAAKFGVEL